MESVSHHILPQMLVSPLWVDLNNLLKDYLKFMDDHFRESADLTFLAYRHRNYSKVRTNCHYTYIFGPTLLQITCYMVQRFTGSDRFIIFLYICFITLYTRQGMVCQHLFFFHVALKMSAGTLSQNLSGLYFCVCCILICTESSACLYYILKYKF